MPSDVKSEYNEGYSDFSNSLDEYRKSHGDRFKMLETGSRFIVINDSIIDRRKLMKSDYGLILINKSGAIGIFEGGLLASEIAKETASFFAE